MENTTSIMTVNQVIEITMNNLRNIPITAGQAESIGRPILQAIDNLQACLDAMAADEAQASEGTEDDITPAMEAEEDGIPEEQRDEFWGEDC